MHYDLIMITTFIDNKYINKMLQSVIMNNHNIDVLIILVNQLDIPLSIDNRNERVHIKIIYAKCGLSLSRARNIAIRYIKTNSIKSHHVMFPDDDSTFDKMFFRAFRDVITLQNSYVIAVYNENTKDYYCPFKFQENQRLERKDFKAAMSVNMIIACDTLFKIGEFDELLGVGARFGSTEDHDYFLRACSITDFRFSCKIYNYHPSKEDLFNNTTLRKLLRRNISYGRGYIYAMLKHKLFLEVFNVTVRALLASCYFLVKLQIKRSVVNFLTFFVRLSHSVYFLSNYNKYFRCRSTKNNTANNS